MACTHSERGISMELTKKARQMRYLFVLFIAALFAAYYLGHKMHPIAGAIVSPAPAATTPLPAQGIGGEYGIVTADELPISVREYDFNPANRGSLYGIVEQGNQVIQAARSNPLSQAQEALQLLNDQSFIQQLQRGY